MGYYAVLMGEQRWTKSLYSPAYMRFLTLLKQARTEAGLTQSKAAHRLGKPQSFISKCESGERRVDVVEFLQFCRLYKVDPVKMFREIEKPPQEKQ
jgi:transcriptional regulator with XRE-family HTH domain